MSPLLVLFTAVSSLGANKMRAGLTLLGIVIGVASVIALMAIGRGAQKSVTQRIEGLGTNLLFVQPGATSEGGIFFGLGSATTLTLEDAAALEDPVFAPAVLKTAPETQVSAQLKAGSKNTRSQILGVTSSYLEVRDYSLQSGRGVSPADVLNRSEVAVLGTGVAETLFGAVDPVGAEMRINGRLFTVVGVLESRGGSAMGNEDDRVLVPVTTAYYRLSTRRTAQGDVNVQSINVQAVDAASMEDAAAQIGTVLRLRHRLAAGEDDDFTVTSQEETIATLEETTQTFVVFLGAIAGISLLVGGIGIMNIMLVSVTERTGEIGIRRALGAKQRDITLQFVTEATLLSIGGGLIGVATGAGIALAIDGRTLGGQTFYTVLTTETAVLALLVSAAIGLFFGIYPALRAARLNPIDALRSA